MRTPGEAAGGEIEGDTPAIALPPHPLVIGSELRATLPHPERRRVAGGVRLDPLLSSVAAARSLVGGVGRRAALELATADDAALVVSELVTNAVLHARTGVDVAVVVVNGGVRLEVTDTSDQPVRLPVARSSPAPVADVFDDSSDGDDGYGWLPTTGRGMELVGALTRAWGVSNRSGGGKTVWAELGPGPLPPTEPDGGPPVPASPEPAGTVVVRLVAVPLRLVLESDQHFDDALRELQVMAMSGVDDALATLAGRAADLRDELRPARLAGHRSVLAARDRGDRLVDLRLELPAGAAGMLERLGRLLSDMAAARRAGQLLGLPPPTEVVAFRLWYRDEVARQASGLHLRPCPFPVVRRGAPHTPGPLGSRRRDLLDRLGSDLTAATDRAEVASTAVHRVATDLGAAFVNLLLATEDRSEVAVADRVGYAPDEARGRRYPVTDDNPICEAVRTARPIVARTSAERIDRYPDLDVSEPVATNPTAVWIPVGRSAPAAGAIVVGFSRSRDFTDADLQWLLEVGASVEERLRAL